MGRAFPEIRTWKICDVGGSQHFWDKIGLNVPYDNITIYNVSSNETQGINDASAAIELVIYDGNRVPVPDNYYDLVVCNSVIEHVPPEQRENLVREMKRVGKRLFLQTPAYEFPIEPHFIMPFVHWLPRELGCLLVHVSPWRLLAKKWPTSWAIRRTWESIELLSLKEAEGLFGAGTISKEKFCGLTKSYYVIL